MVVSFRELEVATVANYLCEQRLVPEGPLEVKELGGGISNVVIRFTAAGVDGVLKQSRERLRTANEWLCDPARIYNEIEVLELLGTLVPGGVVPKVVFRDDRNYLFVMTLAPPGAMLWKPRLLAGLMDRAVAPQLGQLLARVQQGTSGQPGLADRFTDLDLLDQTRIIPYYDATRRSQPRWAAEIANAADLLRQSRDCLVLGDFVPKNIFVTVGWPFLIDFEVAHYGSAGYDPATLLNHLTLKAAALPASQPSLLQAARAFWTSYLENLPSPPAAALEEAVVLQWGVLNLARQFGTSRVEYLSTEAGRHRALALAQLLLDARSVGVLEALDHLPTLWERS